ncbi:hypothetical protein DENIS_0867 [Desulfonema ishimotonii]|uniref:Uncharacterized protein n=1 Tax=Desulfonema ishimotonii TaxID=45657 RepID=A0A401FSI9_9BACT|nr:hypothetical protein [Desulfonema ishimotonii]GBC59925.1 hypothetical protein DENIS_0867 [Desulfonema ishimotonii]
MKICYDNVSSDYSYPVSKKDIGEIKKIILPEITDKIRVIRFGCNTKTTQEGRIVKQGRVYDIRINFCLNNNRSLILSDRKKYIKEIKQFGGSPDFKSGFITWKLNDAKRYSFYILFHEIGHIAFCEKYLNGNQGTKNSSAEEQWCNNFSMKLIRELEKNALFNLPDSDK